MVAIQYHRTVVQPCQNPDANARSLSPGSRILDAPPASQESRPMLAAATRWSRRDVGLLAGGILPIIYKVGLYVGKYLQCIIPSIHPSIRDRRSLPFFSSFSLLFLSFFCGFPPHPPPQNTVCMPCCGLDCDRWASTPPADCHSATVRGVLGSPPSPPPSSPPSSPPSPRRHSCFAVLLLLLLRLATESLTCVREMHWCSALLCSALGIVL